MKSYQEHSNELPKISDYILHAAHLKRVPVVGRAIRNRLQKRAASIAQATMNTTDPDVSIVIRTRNDEQYMPQLFKDIKAQSYSGAIEIVVVDTESTDNTVAYAHAQGAKIITLPQREFTYPHALNIGFEATSHDWVVTLVGHSSLTNSMMFKSLTHWSQNDAIGGIYGIPIANWNGSFWDRFGTMLCLPIFNGHRTAKGPRPGMLGANCSIVNRSVWKKLGGYDEQYAGGGEDTALARAMLQQGFTVVREPLCSVFHSHGLNFRNSWRQWLHWLEVSKAQPQAFDTQKVHSRRPDLR